VDQPVALIVGLGNPGNKYAATRHNAGADLLTRLAVLHGVKWQLQAKLYASTCSITVVNHTVRLAVPTTFMNDSGKAVQALCHFYKLPVEQIVIAHDELDLPCGISRFKIGGGHGGHNGLRNIQKMLGNNSRFARIRIGIDHPGHASKVLNYVLAKPSADEAISIARSHDDILRALPLAVAGEWERAMHQLHTINSL